MYITLHVASWHVWPEIVCATGKVELCGDLHGQNVFLGQAHRHRRRRRSLPSGWKLPARRGLAESSFGAVGRVTKTDREVRKSRAARGTRVQVLILLIFQYGSCYKGHVFWQGMNIVIVIIMILLLLLLLLLLYYHSMFGQPQLHLCAHLNNGATPYSMNNILKYFQVRRMRLCCSWKHFTYVATRRYFIRALIPISGK